MSNNAPTCLFCGNTQTSSTCFEDTVFNNKTFEYVQCSQCDLIFVHPLPNEDDLMKMYPVEYQGALAGDAYGRYDELFQKINTYGKYTTVLDYGCGGGQFVVEAIRNKYTVLGTEYNPELVANLATAFPKAKFQTINDFFKDNSTFDIIFLSNVLEHLTNPREIMELLKERLHPDGVLVLEGPIENNFNLTQITRKIIFYIRKNFFNKKASHTPTHILYSNRINQEQLFKDIGFKTLYFKVDESNWPFPSHYHECKSMMQKVMYFIASFSVRMNKIFSFWGNNFTYIGKKN